MKVLFYSKNCKFSKEIIEKLNESEYSKEFRFINVDTNKVPDKIKVVPTIIDSEYKNLLEGKKAFEYLFNKKYFNISTNNLLLWKDKVIPKPDIAEDKLAKKEEDILESQKILEKQENDEDNPKKQIKLKKNSLLLLKGRSN
mgnify:CR=1 FL=1